MGPSAPARPQLGPTRQPVTRPEVQQEQVYPPRLRRTRKSPDAGLATAAPSPRRSPLNLRPHDGCDRRRLRPRRARIPANAAVKHRSGRPTDQRRAASADRSCRASLWLWTRRHPRGRDFLTPVSARKRDRRPAAPARRVQFPVVTTASCAANARSTCSSPVSTTARPYESSPVRTGPNTTMSPSSRYGRQ